MTGEVDLRFGEIMTQVEPDSSTVPAPQLSWPAMVYPYRAGVIGGALGGLLMIVVAVLYGLSSGHGIWLPVNLIGATLIRDLQTATFEQLTQFNASAFITGLVLHGALAIGLGFIFALLLPTFPGRPLLWAIIIGTLLWALVSVLILPLVNPVMHQYVDWPSFFVAHFLYGGILGWWIGRTPKVKA
jgi:hypothetical protein